MYTYTQTKCPSPSQAASELIQREELTNTLETLFRKKKYTIYLNLSSSTSANKSIKMNRLDLVVFVGVLIVLLSRPPSAAMAQPSCGQVTGNLAPCLSYIQGSGGEPSQACCSGIVAVNNMATSKSDRVTICSCIKQALLSIGSFDPSAVASLPEACGVPIDLPPIDKDFDCSKVSFGGGVRM